MHTTLDRRRFVSTVAATGAVLLLPRQVLGGPAALPPPARRVINVANASALSSALNKALPGDHIVLGNGYYGGSFNLQRSGESAAPIVVRASSPLGATISGQFNIRGHYCQLWSVRIDGGSVLLYGSRNKVMRCRFDRGPTGNGAVTCYLMSGSDAEISANEFFNILNKGIAMRLGYGVRRPLITYNYFKNFQGSPGTNGHEAIQLGYGSNDSYVSLGAIVQYNLMENCGVDDEAISIKSSDNVVAYNTLLNSWRSAIHIRRGARNQIVGNWVENAGGIRVMDLANVVNGNHVSGDKLASFEIFAGNANAGTPSPDAAYPAAKDTLFAGNIGKVIVGRSYSSATPPMRIPAMTTWISAHNGPIVYGTQSSTRVTSTSSLRPISPRKLAPTAVGVRA